MDLSRHWKTVVDTLQDGLMVVDPGGKILAVNPAAEHITGYAAEELVGRSCRILNCTGCKIKGAGPGAEWCSLYSEGVVRNKKCMIIDKDGRTVHVIKSATVLHDKKGRVIGAVETLTDVTESIRQQQEINTLRRTFQLDDGYHGIIGRSEIMQNLFELIENVAQTDTPVMILGPSGSGKELVARAVHMAGARRDKPYIKVNCAALNENLLESELFGHVKGAYTGADRNRTGRFEAAHGGTIFLDEIGDMPLSIQVKLLRVLEEKTIERVGDHKPIPVDVRIITATNKNLETRVKQGGFREDLYFRINVFPLQCPSLVERREDIPLIAQSFIGRNSVKNGKKISGITPEAMDRLIHHQWPGNIRELRNAIEYAFVLCPGGAIDVNHLPPKIALPQTSARSVCSLNPSCMQKREKLIETLRQTGGNQSEAARISGVSRITIWKQIKKYEIDLDRDLAPSCPIG